MRTLLIALAIARHAQLEASRLGAYLVTAEGTVTLELMRKRQAGKVLVFSTGDLMYFLTSEGAMLEESWNHFGSNPGGAPKSRSVFYSELVPHLIELQGMRDFQLREIVKRALVRGGFV